MKRTYYLKSLLYIALLGGVISCGDSSTPDDIQEQDVASAISLPAYSKLGRLYVEVPKESNSFRHYVGAGYDIMGEYLGDSSVKSQIIDMDKSADDLRYTSIKVLVSESKIKVGSDAKAFLYRLAAYKEIPLPDENSDDLLFTETITNSRLVSGEEDYSTLFSFASVDNVYSVAREYIMFLPSKYQYKYYSDEFVDDINSQTADYIIAKYGTHVITDAKVGIIVKNLYRSVVMYEEKEDVVDNIMAGAVERVHDIFSGTLVGIWGVENHNYGGAISSKLLGGDVAKYPEVSQSEREITSGVIDLTEWYNTEDRAKWTLSDLDGGDIVPIYEIIPDKEIADRLKIATIEYIKSKQLGELVDIVPLVHYYNGSNYRYTTSAYIQDSTSGVIGSLFVEHAEGFEPLYHYSNGVCDRLSYEANLASDDMKLIGVIGYTYSSEEDKKDATNRLIEISNNGKYAYILDGLDEDNYIGWKPTGEVIYIMGIDGCKENW